MIQTIFTVSENVYQYVDFGTSTNFRNDYTVKNRIV